MVLGTAQDPATNTCRGFFGHGDMQKEFEEAAFGLNKGEVSGIVDTASGIHLIQRLIRVM
jgi:parvulin-like peptidyl-prolyl isomerase